MPNPNDFSLEEPEDSLDGPVTKLDKSVVRNDSNVENIPASPDIHVDAVPSTKASIPTPSTPLHSYHVIPTNLRKVLCYEDRPTYEIESERVEIPTKSKTPGFWGLKPTSEQIKKYHPDLFQAYRNRIMLEYRKNCETLEVVLKSFYQFLAQNPQLCRDPSDFPEGFRNSTLPKRQR